MPEVKTKYDYSKFEEEASKEEGVGCAIVCYTLCDLPTPIKLEMTLKNLKKMDLIKI